MNLVQIRLWEQTDYLCVAFRLMDGKVHLFPFYLTHEQMEKEVELLGTAAHGGKKIADGNANTESSIRFKISKNDDTFVRWYFLIKYNRRHPVIFYSFVLHTLLLIRV